MLIVATVMFGLVAVKIVMMETSLIEIVVRMVVIIPNIGIGPLAVRGALLVHLVIVLTGVGGGGAKRVASQHLVGRAAILLLVARVVTAMEVI